MKLREAVEKAIKGSGGTVPIKRNDDNDQLRIDPTDVTAQEFHESPVLTCCATYERLVVARTGKREPVLYVLVKVQPSRLTAMYVRYLRASASACELHRRVQYSTVVVV